MMKRFLILSVVSLLSVLSLSGLAVGQVVYTVPEATSTNTIVFSSVTTPQASGCLANQGQNMHFLFYSAGGATGNPRLVRIRLEGSFNSDPATCTTGTWFGISDDGTEPPALGSNLVLAIGSFPFLRANLLNCGTCDVNDTISANYIGTSAAPGNPFGTYSPAQQIRKVLLETSTSTVFSPQVVTPYGSGAGYVVLQSNGGSGFSAGTLITQCNDNGSVLLSSTLVPSTTLFMVPVPASPCLRVNVRCSGCTNGGGTWNIWWIFNPPGAALPYGAQPSNTNNQETTAVNATATVTLSPTALQRGHVFKVSGRCSAGTAQLTVVDTTASVNLYTSGATEVGTTTFRESWNPGLAGASADTITINLTTCGAANTGTLDVQASIF